MVGVVSGKGGVGKTNVVANLAVAAAGLGAKVLVVDGDLGLANLDLVLGLVGGRSAADVLSGECRFDEALVEGPRGIRVLPASSGRSELTALRPRELAPLLVPLLQASDDYDLVLVDLGAGISASVLSLATACDRALLVTTTEPTALADGYATLKLLHRGAPGLDLQVLVNATDDTRARAVHGWLERMTERFLGFAPSYFGHLPRDPRLVTAVRLQQPVVEVFPGATSSRKFVQFANQLLREAEEAENRDPTSSGRTG